MRNFYNSIRNLNSRPEEYIYQIFWTYFCLRFAMFILAFILPLLLVKGGVNRLWWLSKPLEIQNSLSAYYHAGSNCVAGVGVYRDLFVGILCAIGLCLIVYGGHSHLENWLLNFAGFFLGLVAFFPMSWPEPQNVKTCTEIQGFQEFKASQLLNLPISIHFAAAVLFFILLLIVSSCTAMNSLRIIPDRRKRQRWRRVFKWARWLMLIPIAVVLLLKLFYPSFFGNRFVLYIEWVCIWTFSFYWLLKTLEAMDVVSLGSGFLNGQDS